MGFVQERLDGIAPSSHAIRYSGMVDLEDDERQFVKQDQVIVTVTVSRITNVQFPVNKKSGEMTRVNTAVVSAQRVLDGEFRELRELLLERLKLEGDDTLFASAPREHPPDSVLKTGTGVHLGTEPVSAPEPPANVDKDTGEIEPDPEGEAALADEALAAEEDEAEPPGDEVFVPPAREAAPRPTDDTPAGPQPDYDPNAGTRPGVIETVGSVYDGRKRDPVLEQFTAV